MWRLRRFWKIALTVVGLVVLLTIGVLAFVPPKQAMAIIDRGGGDNVAVAFNTRDDSSVFRLLFKITRTANETVDQQNAAIAYSNCDSCQTVSGAMQVVLVMNDDVENVSPTNVAIAVNEECTDCETLASAYQKVMNTDGPVHFSPEGNRRIAELRQKYQELRNSGYSIEEIQTQFDQIWAETNDILATELVDAGSSDDAPHGDGSTPATAEGTPSSATETPAVTPETKTSQTKDEPAATPETKTSQTKNEEPSPASSEPTTSSSEEATTPAGDSTT